MKRVLIIILTALATLGIPFAAMFTSYAVEGVLFLVFGIMIFEHVLVRILPPLETARSRWMLFFISFTLIFIILAIPCLFMYLFLFYAFGLFIWFMSGMLGIFFIKGRYRAKRIILNLAFIAAYASATLFAYLLMESGWERITFS